MLRACMRLCMYACMYECVKACLYVFMIVHSYVHPLYTFTYADGRARMHARKCFCACALVRLIWRLCACALVPVVRVDQARSYALAHVRGVLVSLPTELRTRAKPTTCIPCASKTTIVYAHDNQAHAHISSQAHKLISSQAYKHTSSQAYKHAQAYAPMRELA